MATVMKYPAVIFLVIGACTATPSVKEQLPTLPSAETQSVPWVPLSKPCPVDAPLYALPQPLHDSLTRPDTVLDINNREGELARVVPGGFAGVWVEPGLPSTTERVPIIGLVRPEERDAAVRALRAHGYVTGVDLGRARARQMRWDFAQLNDWYRYLMPRAFALQGVNMSGIDRVGNRIVFGVADSSGLANLASLLEKANVPCFLVAARYGEARSSFRER